MCMKAKKITIKTVIENILISGSLLALVIVVFGYFDKSWVQCPGGYTQAQVDAAGCNIGATIGPTLRFRDMVIVAAFVVVITLFLAFKKK